VDPGLTVVTTRGGRTVVDVDLLAGMGAQPVDQPKPDAEDLVCWSVTTIIGALDKPALLYWSAEQTAHAAIDDQATWNAMVADRGRDEAVKWLRDARFRQPRTRLASSSLGTVVHHLCEQYALTGTRPGVEEITTRIRLEGGDHVDTTTEAAVVEAMLDRFDDWLQRFTPTYQATEVAVYSPTYGVAGQCDAFLTIDGVRFIGDYKTSREPFDTRGQPKTPYPEVALQLAGYRYCEFAAVWRPRRTERFRRRYYLLSPAERAMAVPVPEVDAAICIHITPERCEAFPVRADKTVHTAFLYVLEAARWKFETEKHVIGTPLEATR
jgi:hypothetical protein